MPLPINVTPEYQITLPLSNQTISYRPFIVKEEKILLLASESKDPKQIATAVKQVIRNCTFDKIDIDKLPTVDTEYLFLNIRAMSVGETANPNTKCEKCQGTVPLSVDLTEIKVNTKDLPETKIQLTKSVGVIMRYPDYRLVEETDGKEPDRSKSIELIGSCIERIYDETNVYDTKDFSKSEVMEFVESMTQASFMKIIKFFERIPRLEKTVDYKCPSCKHDGKITLTGLQDFFT